VYFDDEPEEVDGLGTIGCFDSCICNGREIVGLSREGVRTVLGHEDDAEEEADGRTSLEYYELGLQVWIGRDGLCESVMCNVPE
jgi:hypothetical protein